LRGVRLTCDGGVLALPPEGETVDAEPQRLMRFDIYEYITLYVCICIRIQQTSLDVCMYVCIYTTDEFKSLYLESLNVYRGKLRVVLRVRIYGGLLWMYP
jgi:hypothetical protein